MGEGNFLMFDGIKKISNIGGANIAMLLGNDTYSQCEIVSGEILVLGGEHEKFVSSVMVELKEFWTEQWFLD